MFGYVKVNKWDLLVKDYVSYRTCYCCLCNELGKNYGIICRMFLSYDITFLALCLDGIEKETEKSNVFCCPFNPFKKMSYKVSSVAMEYSAFLNFYLTIQKMNDDIIDDKKWIYKIMRYFLVKNRHYRKMFEEHKEQLQTLQMLLDEFNQLEKKTEASFDELTNSMGMYFAELFGLYLEWRKIQDDMLCEKIRMLGFNLGKWIYLMDAYEDYEKDKKKGRFNLVSRMMKEGDSIENIDIHNKIKTINQMLMIHMHCAVKDIGFEKNGTIIKNIIEEGCFLTYKRIIEKRYPHVAEQFWPKVMEE